MIQNGPTVMLNLDGRMDGLSSTLKQASSETGRYTSVMNSSFGQVDGGIRSVGVSMGTLATAAAAASAAVTVAMGTVVADVTLLAARVNTLGVVMQVVGNNQGYTGAQMEQYARGVAEMGITTQVSRKAVVEMAQAHMDLSKAQELARTAQDAAVIGSINSSEALDTMIHGIQSAQVDVLRTIGINVSFEDSYKKLAATLGKSKESLSETEKMQARLNVVLEKGGDIAGTYEAAMTTAGKQLQSLPRYFEEIKLAVGDPFTESFSLVLTDIARGLKDILKALQENKTELMGFGEGLSGSYRYVRNEINQFAADLDKIGGKLTTIGSVAFKTAELGTRFMTLGQFGDNFRDAADQFNAWNKMYEDRYKRMRAADEAYQATIGVSGPVLDPSEQGRLRMLKDAAELKKIKNRSGSPTDPEPAAKETDKTQELYNFYSSALDGYNEKIRALNPTISELDRSLAGVDDQLARQLEKFAGFENNPGVQKYLESLKTAAQHSKDALQYKFNRDTFFDELSGSDAYLNALGKMGTQQSLQPDGTYKSQQDNFDQRAMQSSWATRNAESDRTAQLQGDQFSSQGDPLNAQLVRIDQEQQAWEQSWAMQTDSYAVYEQRKAEIARHYDQERLKIMVEGTESRLAFERASGMKQIGMVATAGMQMTNAVANSNKAMFMANKAFRLVEAGMELKAGIIKTWNSFPYPYNIVMTGLHMAAGVSQLNDLASANYGGGSPGGNYGGGTPTSPIVTQPQGSLQKNDGINITVRVDGNMYADDRWIEETLAPAIRDLATNRNVQFGFEPRS